MPHYRDQYRRLFCAHGRNFDKNAVKSHVVNIINALRTQRKRSKGDLDALSMLRVHCKSNWERRNRIESEPRYRSYYKAIPGVVDFTLFSAISLRFGEKFQSPRAQSGRRLIAGSVTGILLFTTVLEKGKNVMPLDGDSTIICNIPFI